MRPLSSSPASCAGMKGRAPGAHAEDTQKKLRYAVLSAAFLPAGQVLIQLIGWWLDNYTAASLLASAIIILPLFYANRRFVWRVTSPENLRSQALVFWVVMMVSACLTTLFTGFIEHEMRSQTTLLRGMAVLGAQVFGLAVVWTARFVLLDRWLFQLVERSTHHQ